MIQATQRLKAELAGQVEALKKERKELDQRETELASVSIMILYHLLNVAKFGNSFLGTACICS